MQLIISPEAQQTPEQSQALEQALRADTSSMRLCPCGRMFQPYRDFQKFCCDAHRVKYSSGKPSAYVKRPAETRPCKNCGKEFTTNDSKKHYCSHDCYEAYQLKRRADVEVRTCLQCGNKFETTHWSKRYCSTECRMKARSNT